MQGVQRAWNFNFIIDLVRVYTVKNEYWNDVMREWCSGVDDNEWSHDAKIAHQPLFDPCIGRLLEAHPGGASQHTVM